MRKPARIAFLLCSLAAILALLVFNASPPVVAAPKPETYWQVDDVRTGMKGVGRTVMKGSKVEDFDAEVLGVLMNTSPGRDMVLCRLSGLGLEKTGVIAGMSGSPIYIDGKLLGAVAYAWPYGKEPIAGVTPFCQMHGFVEAYERRDLAEKGKPIRVGLREPLRINGKSFESATVSETFDNPAPREADGLWLTPLRTPLSASGFTPHSLELLRERCGDSGLVPVQGGAATARVAEEEKNVVLEPGGSLALAMITGDFDLSGIGTVTHIEGDRVYGWGHPFMGLGACEFPLMTGYIHTIYPRQTVSFKMGSPLKTVGVVNADVSTCIAGWLGRKPDMLPVRMTVALGEKGAVRTYNVQTVRQRSLLSNLVFTALTNSVDMEGELPEEMTAEFEARIELEGRDPVIVKDVFSGFSGGRAPAALYGQVAGVVGLLANNPYEPLRATRIECDTRVSAERRTADIETMELDSDAYEPGGEVKASVFIRPYKGAPKRLTAKLKLPSDLPEGDYTVSASDEASAARLTLRDDPNLSSPQNVEQVLRAVRLLTEAKRTRLTLRVQLGAAGVAVGGKSLPDLPAGVVQILGASRRTGAQPIAGALTSSQGTDWVVQGSESAHFLVVRHKRATGEEGH
jgi:SpoIVB peptidase S55